jgi:putative ABC transport system ATP-binding protein
VIKLEDIEVIYGLGTDTEIRALHIPSLEIGSGCWCNVIGPNGSGKTTLLKVLSGGIDSFSGSVFIDGRNVTKWKARHLSSTIQLLEQSPERNTVPSMTIEENLRLYSQEWTFPFLCVLRQG